LTPPHGPRFAKSAIVVDLTGHFAKNVHERRERRPGVVPAVMPAERNEHP
jgi:hypothetical protein